MSTDSLILNSETEESSLNFDETVDFSSYYYANADANTKTIVDNEFSQSFNFKRTQESTESLTEMPDSVLVNPEIDTNQQIVSDLNSDSSTYIIEPDSSKLSVSQTDTVHETVSDSLTQISKVEKSTSDSVVQITEKQAKTSEKTIQPSNKTYSDWSLLVILFGFGLLALLRTLHPNYIQKTIFSLISLKEFTKFLRESNILNNRASNLLILLFSLNLSLFIYFIGIHFKLYDFQYHPLLYFASFTGIIIVIYAGKYFIYRFFGELLGLRALTANLNNTILVFNKGLGLFLFPIIIAIPYMTEAIQEVAFFLGLALIGVIYILRLFRELRIILKKQFPILYLILYLCALEILPILVMGKLLNILIIN